MRDAMMEGIGYLATANTQVACVVMIETEEGLRNVVEIAAVDGIDGLFVGPMDLCYGLNITPGSFTDYRFTDAIARILAARKAHDRAAGIFGYTAEIAADSLQSGFDFASIGTDVGFLRDGAAQALAVARGKDEGPANAPAPQGGY
jgi:4-hydroxy-2-oxoheptanedioate aldolase